MSPVYLVSPFFFFDDTCDDVPEGALGMARARQVNIDGYARRNDDG